MVGTFREQMARMEAECRERMARMEAKTLVLLAIQTRLQSHEKELHDVLLQEPTCEEIQQVQQLCRERVNKINDQIRGLHGQYDAEKEKFERAIKYERFYALLIPNY